MTIKHMRESVSHLKKKIAVAHENVGNKVNVAETQIDEMSAKAEHWVDDVIQDIDEVLKELVEVTNFPPLEGPE